MISASWPCRHHTTTGAAPTEEPVRTLDTLLRLRAATHATNTIISYPTTAHDFIEYTAADLDRATTLAATIYTKTIPEDVLRREGSDSAATVVGIIGVGSLEYIVTFLALQRLGVTCLFLSTRLQDAGFIHLITETRCKAVVVQKRFQGALERVRNAVGGLLALVPMLEGPYILNPAVMDALRPIDLQLDPPRDDIPGWIIHSSGTTGLPKPVSIYAHRAIASLMRLGQHPDTLSTLPLFHSFGLSTLNHAIVSGTKLSLMSSDHPITGPGVLSALDRSKSKKLVTVPYVLQLLVETDGWAERLARLDEVTFGGSPIPEELGERLVAAGVKLTNHYGLSECGGRMMGPSADQWNWLNVLPHAEPYVRFELESERDCVFRLVVLPGLPTKAFTNREDGAYDTKDLFQQHPTDQRKWKFVGRQDDTIVLVNGEKANAIPFELAAGKIQDVQAAVVFGEQRDSLGLIIIPAPATELTKSEMMASIIQEIQAVNEAVPAYARISQDAIMVMDPNTPFPSTDKGTIIRSAFYRQFAADIEAYYSGVLNPEGNKTGHGERSLRKIVRLFVQEALRLQDSSCLSDDADFFSMGMDSLQATTVRAKLAREIDSSISTNVVFENPSVERLTRYLANRGCGLKDGRSTETIARDLVQKYSVFGPTGTDRVCDRLSNEVVLLTGATGSLGCHILSTLLQRENVEKVHCLVRAKDTNTASLRIRNALRNACLFDRLSEKQRNKLIAHPHNLSEEQLGLSRNTYNEIVASVTTIIHGAWTVNFNMDLTSFEMHCIRGSWNLINNICLRSPRDILPSFNFISTVATMSRSQMDPILEMPSSFDDCNNTGYGQSKWVVEQACATATAQTGIPTRILRIGQVVGDTDCGMWNPKEAIPMTVQSVLATGALPLHDERECLSWLPVDVTATAVVELSLLDQTDPGYVSSPHAIYHVCNPNAFSWNRDFLSALEKHGLEFERVTGPEWIRRLEKSNPDPEQNPPIKLLHWYRGMYDRKDSKELPTARFATIESQKASPSLREARELGEDLIGKFLSYWIEKVWTLAPKRVYR